MSQVGVHSFDDMFSALVECAYGKAEFWFQRFRAAAVGRTWVRMFTWHPVNRIELQAKKEAKHVDLPHTTHSVFNLFTRCVSPLTFFEPPVFTAPFRSLVLCLVVGFSMCTDVCTAHQGCQIV